MGPPLDEGHWTPLAASGQEWPPTGRPVAGWPGSSGSSGAGSALCKLGAAGECALNIIKRGVWRREEEGRPEGDGGWAARERERRWLVWLEGETDSGRRPQTDTGRAECTVRGIVLSAAVRAFGRRSHCASRAGRVRASAANCGQVCAPRPLCGCGRAALTPHCSPSGSAQPAPAPRPPGWKIGRRNIVPRPLSAACEPRPHGKKANCSARIRRAVGEHNWPAANCAPLAGRRPSEATRGRKSPSLGVCSPSIWTWGRPFAAGHLPLEGNQQAQSLGSKQTGKSQTGAPQTGRPLGCKRGLISALGSPSFGRQPRLPQTVWGARVAKWRWAWPWEVGPVGRLSGGARVAAGRVGAP